MRRSPLDARQPVHDRSPGRRSRAGRNRRRVAASVRLLHLREVLRPHAQVFFARLARRPGVAVHLRASFAGPAFSRYVRMRSAYQLSRAHSGTVSQPACRARCQGASRPLRVSYRSSPVKGLVDFPDALQDVRDLRVVGSGAGQGAAFQVEGVAAGLEHRRGAEALELVEQAVHHGAVGAGADGLREERLRGAMPGASPAR